LIISSATAAYLFVQPRGEEVEEEWWWDYLDMKAERALGILLDDSTPLVKGLSGREALLALFTPEILSVLSLTSTELFELLLKAMKLVVGNATGFKLSVEGERVSFEGGDPLAEERVARGAVLSEGITVRVYVGWGVGHL